MTSRAILLLGPTGSGKTPLGDLIQTRGLGGRRCLHFDFGANLRRVVERNEPDALLGRRELDFLASVLHSGALLEDEHFYIANRILQSFLAERNADERTTVVLNGLPRHVGQADAIDGILDVALVVSLECSPANVFERIRVNAGGDRACRCDDQPEAVAQKLILYRQRTAPLVEHYRARGSHVVPLEVIADTTANALWQCLASLAEFE